MGRNAAQTDNRNNLGAIVLTSVVGRDPYGLNR
jgi:hypothetical protein